ncbi:HAMP domain-containing histidine kinase [Bacillus sp. NTK071]|uniref:histidine kinase n=1 Tax=Guptibacillus hwajinpoensis TaxID=208199 RepID=A0A4U1MKE0_9BACL|nr:MULTISPECIES: HAMP domain-containing sensor histidine kinase [Bacillaceae]MBN8207809.1 HAMP domain-containing histidine kinase [Bacillus sp. NTK071]TKD71327.1 HAMP domain-containing histidine kinase [Pseudalkalibacillus hwajinpoensis]
MAFKRKNKLATKLGLMFLISILLLEGILFVVLYFGFLNERIMAETDALLARGNSHRDVLEKHFDSETRDHVALMESEADTQVVITDNKKNILVHSNEVTPPIKKMIQSSNSLPVDGAVIEGDWVREPNVTSGSPIIINDELVGYVYMVLDTQGIRDVRDHLTAQFLIISGLALFLTIITIIYLSRIIIRPLIHMKEATKKMSAGEHDVSLKVDRNDELGELAKAIQSLSDDLLRLKNDRSDFLASIAHELRTPLTYLSGYADIAQRDNLSSEERQYYLSIIKEESGNLTSLVRDLFNMAKMDQKGFVIDKEEIELCRLMQQVNEKVKPAFDSKGIHLLISCQRKILVSLDPGRFSQVLLNLLDNALHYSKEGDTVLVEASLNHSKVEVNVIDEGEGIPDKDLPYIFDRLYRVDKSRSRKYGGSGLGLAIAKEIIEKHGGSISALSKEGKGTTMKIVIPGDD